MHRTSVLAIFLLAHAVYVHSHTYLSSLTIDGTVLSEGDCLRPYIPHTAENERDNPILSVLAQDMTCGWLPNAALPANRKCPVNPGSTVSMQWHHENNDADDDIIAVSHLGPCMVYMAKSDTGAGPVWFKIYEDGYDNVTKKWCVDKLLANAGVFTFTVPTDIAPGNYLLRGEIIALHGANALGGSQPYVLCAEITVSGSGTVQPAGVSIPGAYQLTDPGILFNLYQPYTNYIIPGPPVYKSGSVAPSGPATTAPSTPAPSTSAPSTPAPSTTAPAATSAPTIKPVSPTATPPLTTVGGPVGASSVTSIKIQLHSATSIYWFAVAIDSGAVVTSNVEFKDNTMQNFMPFLTTTWGYWVFQPSNAIILPVSLRLTSESGAQVTLSNIINSLSLVAPIDTRITYPTTGTSTSSPSTASPTVQPPTNAPSTQSPSTQSPSTNAPSTSAPTTPSPSSGSQQETVQIALHPGSSLWWLAVAIMNGGSETNTFELKDSGSVSSWTPLVDSSWGYWTYATTGTSLQLPIYLRATSKSGKTAEVTFTSISSFSPVDTGVEF